MKNNWSIKFLPGMEEISTEESAVIIGGESPWYWFAYGFGSLSLLIK